MQTSEVCKRLLSSFKHQRRNRMKMKGGKKKPVYSDEFYLCTIKVVASDCLYFPLRIIKLLISVFFHQASLVLSGNMKTKDSWEAHIGQLDKFNNFTKKINQKNNFVIASNDKQNTDTNTDTWLN